MIYLWQVLKHMCIDFFEEHISRGNLIVLLNIVFTGKEEEGRTDEEKELLMAFS